MTLGVFSIIKNEAPWIGYCVMAARHVAQQFVYCDGNSTDGTLELLDYLKEKYHLRIEVYRDMDPKDLKDDYVRVFNEGLGKLKTDYAWYLHPDMIVTENGTGPWEGSAKAPLAMTVGMRSFGGDPNSDILEITEGRAKTWKTIHRRAFGLHYYGHYGAQNEDLYHRDITGDAHMLYEDVSRYPFEVEPSGISISHFSDVRPYSRRLGRMIACLKNQTGCDDLTAREHAITHPRVSLEPAEKRWGKFSFKEATNFPQVFYEHADEFAAVLGKRFEEVCWLPIVTPAAWGKGGVHINPEKVKTYD